MEPEKWWLKRPEVPPKGLSEEARKTLQRRRDGTDQIRKDFSLMAYFHEKSFDIPLYLALNVHTS
ncbi:hypothetical protein RJ639_013230 [Escallonia herrerae]|uniref:PRONE domain-containing protein n=1 Tax=Escallonia herrerae TaxID=1293975 RepID=A0AA89AMX6_9ASTE|nr:hypothetical protein RJ639_013230 [Escallonia herrerae]